MSSTQKSQRLNAIRAAVDNCAGSSLDEKPSSPVGDLISDHAWHIGVSIAHLKEWASNYADHEHSPSRVLQDQINKSIDAAVKQAKATGKPVAMSSSNPWVVVSNNNGDAYNTVGHYSVSTTVSVYAYPDGSFRVQYQKHLADWYDYANDNKYNPDHPHSEVLNQLHDQEAQGKSWKSSRFPRHWIRNCPVLDR